MPERLRDGRWRLAGRVVVASAALSWSFARSGGPGGQHVNTSDSKVELRLRPEALVGLDAGGRARLAALAGRRLTASGDLILVAEEHRSQAANRVVVLERLEDLVARALVVPRKRRATKPSRGAVERRLASKKARGAAKARRRERPE